MDEAANINPEITPDAPEVDGAEGPDTSEMPEWMKAKHRVEIDGEEVELDYEELRRGYQRSSAANKRFLEAKRLREEAQQDEQKIRQIFALAKDDPDLLLQALGVEPLTYAEKRILKQIEQEKKSPEQLEAEKWKSEAQKYREEVERREAEAAAAQEQAELEKWMSTFESMIEDTISKSGLVKNPTTTAWVAKYIEVALANDEQPNIDDMAQALVEEFGGSARSLPPEVLAKLLGEEHLKGLREYDIGRLKSEKTFAKQTTGKPAEKPSKQERLPASDFFESIRRKHGIST
jgi:hypothetical protein